MTAVVSHTFTTTTGSTFTTTQTLVEAGVPYGILLGSSLQVTNSLLSTYTGVNPGAGNANDSVHAISWSPDNRFMIVGGLYPEAGTHDLALYAFDPSNSNTLQSIEFVNTGTGNFNDQVLSVHWSPNGKYIAVGTKHVSNTTDIQVYYFDICSPAAPLTLVSSVSTSTFTDNACYSVRWSPNNQYLAAGGSFSNSASPLKIYSFTTIPYTILTDLGVSTTDITSTSTIFSVDWSPNGNYIAVGGALSGTGPTDRVHVYSFNPASTPILSRVTSVDPGSGSTGESTHAVRWSPDGNYLAVGSNVVTSLIITQTSQVITPTSTSVLFGPGVTVPGNGSATLYPTTISFTASSTFIITQVIAGLYNLTAPSPANLEVLLVSPAGQNTLLMNDNGNTDLVSSITLIFSDSASQTLTCTSQIITSDPNNPATFYTPSGTTCSATTNFVPPAPAPTYGQTLSVMNGFDARGTWSLYIVDGSFTMTSTLR